MDFCIGIEIPLRILVSNTLFIKKIDLLLYLLYLYNNLMGYAQSKMDSIDDDTIADAYDNLMANAYDDFIEHNVNPDTIKAIVELTLNKKFDNMPDYYIFNAQPTLKRYIVNNDKYYSFPNILRERVDYKSLCVMGMLNWLEFYHKILESGDKESYICDALPGDQDYYRELFNTTLDHGVHDNLVIHGHFECLKFVVSKGCIVTENMLDLSIKYGQMKIFKYLCRKLSKTIDVIYLCMMYERYDMMDSALKNKYRFNIVSCKELPKCKEYLKTYCEKYNFLFTDEIYDSLNQDKFIHFRGLFKSHL